MTQCAPTRLLHRQWRVEKESPARSGQILRKLPEMEALALLLAFRQFMKRVLLACTPATAAQFNIFLPHVSRAPTPLAGLYIDTTH